MERARETKPFEIFSRETRWKEEEEEVEEEEEEPLLGVDSREEPAGSSYGVGERGREG